MRPVPGTEPSRRPPPGAVLFAAIVAAFLSGCDAPPRLPLASESEHFRYHYEAGQSVDAPRLEAHYAWVTAQLGVTLPRKIDYHKYRSHQQMGDYTGYYEWDGFALAELFELHTMWSWDNHETVHIYSALVGRPSDFFNEGIAVAFQTDPLAGYYESVFNSRTVHEWAKLRLRAGTLLPLDRMIYTHGFRAVEDEESSYREAGSFVRYLFDTYGMPPLADFMRRSARRDYPDVVEARFAEAFGLSLGESEALWHVFLQEHEP
jgi:hypothetical protein